MSSFYGSPQSLEDIPEGYGGKSSRSYLLHLHQAITKRDVWALVAEEPPKDKGFMFASREERPWQEECEMDPLVLQDGHSGASLGFFWRACQRIAQIGWAEFCREWEPDSQERDHDEVQIEGL